MSRDVIEALLELVAYHLEGTTSGVYHIYDDCSHIQYKSDLLKSKPETLKKGTGGRKEICCRCRSKVLRGVPIK